jgi:hypothetical protein
MAQFLAERPLDGVFVQEPDLLEVNPAMFQMAARML